ncbi:MAG: response regulator transcription factor [Peptostreptococcaceae bacterium]|nr:response regulator transcription factor [Peptostreptococcaceae bacterium]
MRIFIIEDDEVILTSLSNELKKWNFEVSSPKDLSKVMDDFAEEEPHLVIVDIMLPYYNGYYWCSEIRKVSKVPIVFLSSKAENMDIVMAMQSGADDYITKPFDFAVVIAKIQAILRRCYDLSEGVDHLSYGEIRLSLGEMKIIYHDREVHLTRTEQQIMESLFQKRGGFVSRESIMEKCWQKDGYIDDNTLAVNVARLRKKLDEIGLGNLIVTKKNVGYGLNDIYNTNIF